MAVTINFIEIQSAYCTIHPFRVSTQGVVRPSLHRCDNILITPKKESCTHYQSPCPATPSSPWQPSAYFLFA